jgi:hypothetical protein
MLCVRSTLCSVSFVMRFLNIDYKFLMMHNCRQLISRVLASCKSCWLAEPQLAADVSTKLLADLRQLLPPPQPPAAAAAATTSTDTKRQETEHSARSDELKDSTSVEEAPREHADQVLDEQQQQQQGEGDSQEQQQKFLALLSCLVAILHAAGSLPSCQNLVADAAALMATAHERCCVESDAAASAAAVAACEAAASLASLMLVLWQSTAADAAAGAAAARHESSEQAVSSGGAAAATLEAVQDDSSGDSAELSSAAEIDNSSISSSTAAQKSTQDESSGKATELASSAECSSCSSSSSTAAVVFSSAWAAVLRTLKLQQLSKEDATALLDSMSKAVEGLHTLSKQQQQQQQQWLQELCGELPVQLFRETLHFRWVRCRACVSNFKLLPLSSNRSCCW